MLPPPVMRGAAARRDGNERIDADVVGDAEALAAGVNELAAQLSGRREGHGVDEDIELAVFLFERGEEGFNLLVVGDIALETARAGQLGDEVFGLEPHAVILIANGQGGAGLVQFLGDAPGDGTLVGQPEDHGRLTRQIDHACFLPPGSVLWGYRTYLPIRIPERFSNFVPLPMLCKRLRVI